MPVEAGLGGESLPAKLALEGVIAGQRYPVGLEVLAEFTFTCLLLLLLLDCHRRLLLLLLLLLLLHHGDSEWHSRRQLGLCVIASECFEAHLVGGFL